MKKNMIAAAIAAAGAGIGIATWLFMKKRRTARDNNEAEQRGKMSTDQHHLTNAFSHAKAHAAGHTFE